MAGCNMCGYFVPDDAKKCAHCGTYLHLTLRQRVWTAVAALTNLGAILASFATCIMAIVMVLQTRSMENQAASLEAQTQALQKQAASIGAQTNILQKNFELQYIPRIKIGPVAFNFVHYDDGTASGSMAMYFTIPLENEHGYAYKVKIVKKILTLLRGEYGLETSCMQNALTRNSFDLSSGTIRYDQIGIDESVSNFEKFKIGAASFKLEYIIEYEAMPEVKKGTYVYKYIIEFKGGQQEVVTEKTVPPEEKT